jgi:hypothetical protein
MAIWFIFLFEVCAVLNVVLGEAVEPYLLNQTQQTLSRNTVHYEQY